MKERIASAVLILLILLLPAVEPAAAADTFKVDPVHSSVIFRVKHLGVAYYNGRFEKITGTVVVDDANPANYSVEIEIDVSSVHTGVERRNQHIMSPDFFNAVQFPVIRFKSHSAKKTGENTFEVRGEITIRGVTKPLTVSVEKVGEADLGRMGYRAGFSARFTVNRMDFGVSYMPQGLGEEIQITLDIEAVRQ